LTDLGLIDENLRLLSDPKVLSNLEAAWQAGDLQEKRGLVMEIQFVVDSHVADELESEFAVLELAKKEVVWRRG